MKGGWLQKIVTRVVTELLREEIEKLEKKIAQLEKEQATVPHRLDRIEQELNKLSDRMYEADKQAAKIEGLLLAMHLLRESKSSGGE